MCQIDSQHHVTPSNVTFVQLIKILGENYEYDRMTAVIERMQDYNLPITGDMYTLLQFIILTSYAALIDSLEDPNMALHVYKQAKRDVYYSILRLMKIVVSKRSIRKSFVSTIMLL